MERANRQGDIMEDNRAEQIEALQAMLEYNPKLLRAMKAVAEELAGSRQPDTDEYLLAVIKGMNWEIAVFNGTMEVLKEQDTAIDKAAANDAFVAFSDLYKNKDDKGMAECLQQKIIPFFEVFEEAATKRCAM